MDESPLIYPAVAGEFETIDKVLAGYSLSRYGDGELKVLYGAGYSREPKNKRLTEELRASFLTPHERCLVGIPTMDPAGPKYQELDAARGTVQRDLGAWLPVRFGFCDSSR
jgi:hypothetical protein